MNRALLAACVLVLPLAGGCGGAVALPETTEVRVERPGETAHLSDVRLARHDGFDRLVLEFTDRVPGYAVAYRPLPAHQDASGHEIPLPGAAAFVQVTLTPATASGWTEDPVTYVGPPTVTADTEVVTEVSAAGDFEAMLTWVAGVRDEVPFEVDVLASPPRLVVDFRHAAA
jgi:hypothetical protein